jgi:hypothetical protein
MRPDELKQQLQELRSKLSLIESSIDGKLSHSNSTVITNEPTVT